MFAQSDVITIHYKLSERSRGLVDKAAIDAMKLDDTDKAEQALRAIGWEGRFLVIGFTGGIPSIPLNLTLLKGCQIVGVFYGAMTARQPELNAMISDELIQLVASGELRPHVSARYPLEQAGDALRSLMDRTAVGKVVITP